MCALRATKIVSQKIAHPKKFQPFLSTAVVFRSADSCSEERLSAFPVKCTGTRIGWNNFIIEISKYGRMRVEIQSSDLSEGKKNALMRSSAATLAAMLNTFSNQFSNGLLRGHGHWRVHDIFGGTDSDIGCRKRTGRQAKQNLLLLQRCDFCV